jgi:hypothetical protein
MNCFGNFIFHSRNSTLSNDTIGNHCSKPNIVIFETLTSKGLAFSPRQVGIPSVAPQRQPFGPGALLSVALMRSSGDSHLPLWRRLPPSTAR